jgi:hypothetical protein
VFGFVISASHELKKNDSRGDGRKEGQREERRDRKKGGRIEGIEVQDLTFY